MKYSGLILPLVLLAFPARAADTPMVWAFQHFCADESFTLDEARLAIALAGGKQRGPAASVDFPNPMSITFWDIVIGGHKIGISLGNQHVPAGPGAADMASCAVYADGRDDAGIAALHRWAAVAPYTTPAPNTALYRFTSEQGRHIPIPDSEAASAAGHIWQLTLVGGKSANVTVMRFFKTRANS